MSLNSSWWEIQFYTSKGVCSRGYTCSGAMYAETNYSVCGHCHWSYLKGGGASLASYSLNIVHWYTDLSPALKFVNISSSEERGTHWYYSQTTLKYKFVRLHAHTIQTYPDEISTHLLKHPQTHTHTHKGREGEGEGRNYSEAASWCWYLSPL